MNNPYDDHIESVAAARNEALELQRLLSTTKAKAEQVAGAVVNAVGEAPRNTSGQEAIGVISQISSSLDELIGMTIKLDEDLTAYGEMF